METPFSPGVADTPIVGASPSVDPDGETYSRENDMTCLPGVSKKQASAGPEVPGFPSGGDRQRDNAWHVWPHTAVGVH